jgi:hypothetical protein
LWRQLRILWVSMKSEAFSCQRLTLGQCFKF